TVVAERVARARKIQEERYTALGLPSSTTNARCSAALIEEVAAPDSNGLALLQDASEKMGLSARAYHRVLKVARTLADLEGQEGVGRIHLAEAISYRMAGERLAQAAGRPRKDEHISAADKQREPLQIPQSMEHPRFGARTNRNQNPSILAAARNEVLVINEKLASG